MTPKIEIGFTQDLGVGVEDIAGFYDETWQRRIALSLPDFVQWQFVDPPDGDGQNRCVVCIQSGKILSIMGANERVFLTRGMAHRGAELTTWIASPDARGMGIGGKILSFLQSKYDVLAGAGITQAALSLYLAAGFVFKSQLPRFVFITDFALAKRFTDIPARVKNLTQLRQTAGATPTKWQATPCAAADLGDLQDQFTKTASLFSRDAANLAWRYDNHPVLRYAAYKVGGMGVILREDNVLDTPFLHVVDLFGDLADLSAALAFIEHETQIRRAAFVDCTALHARIAAGLRLRGWSSMVDDPFLQVPSLFYPVEMRRPPTGSLCFWSRSNRESLYGFDRLHVTKGDLDLDRPTQAYYAAKGIPLTPSAKPGSPQ